MENQGRRLIDTLSEDIENVFLEQIKKDIKIILLENLIKEVEAIPINEFSQTGMMQ